VKQPFKQFIGYFYCEFENKSNRTNECLEMV